MAEEGAPIINNQRLLIVASVVVGIAVLFLLWSFRGCISMPVGRGDGYVNIYTNLELKDAANVITRLKELKLSYKVSQNGTAISVPKDKADEARLGLAEKNLPQGGAVGWEIFNETRMGATDFDRRIQLIRAISGELSRNIRRIEGVEDARVQIVLPETRLFEVSKAPVTAAVLLKLSPGSRLKSDQVNGIIHLVASSVENLKPENVTIVDDSGNILSKNISSQMPQPAQPEEIVKSTVKAPVEQEIIKKEEVKPPVTSEAKAKAPSVGAAVPVKKVEAVPTAEAKVLSIDEKALLKLKAKDEYERQLTAKVQELLNQFYPPNSVIVRVSLMFGEAKKGNGSTKLKIFTENEPGYILTSIKRITTIVLIDNRLKLSNKMKTSTYQTIALSIPYNKKRGDRIILKQVPFHYAEVLPEKMKQKPEKPALPRAASLGYLVWGGVIIVVVAVVLVLLRARKPRQEMEPLEETEGRLETPSAPTENEATKTVKQIKDLAQSNPERIANLLKKWLSEEEE